MFIAGESQILFWDIAGDVFCAFRFTLLYIDASEFIGGNSAGQAIRTLRVF